MIPFIGKEDKFRCGAVLFALTKLETSDRYLRGGIKEPIGYNLGQGLAWRYKFASQQHIDRT